MGIPPVQLDADALNAHLDAAFSEARPYRVVASGPGVLTVGLGDADVAIRPGGTVSGPTLMGLVDAAAWLVVLAHIGWEPLAVTSSLSINFLAKPEPAGLVAEAELLKLGRRLAVVDVRVLGGEPRRLVADASVTYAIPSSSAWAGGDGP
jgi:acyl-coenzyme A thioesterase PaaI-like protein